MSHQLDMVRMKWRQYEATCRELKQARRREPHSARSGKLKKRAASDYLTYVNAVEKIPEVAPRLQLH